MPENKKQTMGRRKIEIKKIGREESRQVCFSKRRAGLFKKANELSILCGAELAVLVVSPGGKPYSFSHPSLQLISNRFLNPSDDDHNGRRPSSCTSIITSANQSMSDLSSTQNLNNTYILSRMHESCLELMEKERHRKAELDDVLRGTWFSEENLGKFDLGQLDFIQTNLASIREDVHKLLINAKSVYEQQHHHHPHIVENMMELSNAVAGNYDPGQDSFMVAPLSVMNGHDVLNCFPFAYYDYKGACQF